MGGGLERSPGAVRPEVLPARRDAMPVPVTATGAETRSARLKGFTLGELVKMGQIASSAAMFGGKRPEDRVTAEQATMKILAGLEIDIPVTQALAMIDIIDGQPAYRAQLMAAVIKRSRKYRYRVVEWTAERCEISWQERDPDTAEWFEPGPSTSFDLEDAKVAGLLDKTGSNYKRYPKSMLFARALSSGARAYCADVMAAAYTPEELREGGDPDTYDEYAEKVNHPDYQHAPVGDVVDGTAEEVSEDAPAQGMGPVRGTGDAGPTPDSASPAQELYELIGSGRIEEDDQVNAAQVRQLRKLAEPFDSADLARVVAYATRGDGPRHTNAPGNLTTQRFGELRHFFENEQPGDRPRLIDAVIAWEHTAGGAQEAMPV